MGCGGLDLLTRSQARSSRQRRSERNRYQLTIGRVEEYSHLQGSEGGRSSQLRLWTPKVNAAPFPNPVPLAAHCTALLFAPPTIRFTSRAPPGPLSRRPNIFNSSLDIPFPKCHLTYHFHNVRCLTYHS